MGKSIYRKKAFRKVVNEFNFSDTKAFGWVEIPKKYRYNSIKGRTLIRLLKQLIAKI